MKTAFRIFKIGIIATVLVFFLDSIFNNFEIDRIKNLKVWGLYFFYSFSITIVNIIFSILFEKFVGWKNAGIRKLLASTAGTVIITLGTYFFCRLIHLTYIENEYSVAVFLEKERLGNYIFPLLFSTTISLFLHLLYFFKATQEKKVKEQKIIAGSATARFDALKNQLDPHFLFNSLNVLTSLIEENPDQAQKFTTSLSKVYRYVLEQKNKELVNIEDELSFAKRYIDLLKMRFENSVIYTIPQEIANLEGKIIPLSLQLLLENAVKHNKVSEENPLHISILEVDGFLVVKNNLQAKNVIGKSSGYGLSNIQQRYNLLTSRKVLIQKDKTSFQVKLPILTKQLHVIRELPQTQEKMRDYNKLDRARAIVKKQKEFYASLTSYMIVIPFLAFINWFTTGFGFPWFLFAAAGWGIGLVFQYMEAFDKNPFFSKDWEERKIKEFMDKDNY
ncbi:2TM domain-containing protein [Zunongwangia sp.]|uniref:2TM domain-containing protein n=1 Tax=Zunongwangia sp. TaxID=1965325 RepID=UPI003AA8FB6D